jgi:hypothetical protein
MAQIKDAGINEKQFYELIQPFVNDLTAVFGLMHEDALRLLDTARKEGWTPEKLIAEVEKLI